MEAIGVGLGALAFWGFLAAVAVTGIRAASRHRELQLETLRSFIESGKELNPEIMNRLLPVNNRLDQRPDVALKIASVILVFVAIGLAMLAYFVARVEPEALYPILGSSLLVICISVGLFIASKVVKSSGNEGKSENGTLRG